MRQRCKESGMYTVIDRFRREEEGAALVEYGMLVGLIAVICVIAVTTLGTEVSTAFSNIANALSRALNERRRWAVGREVSSVRLQISIRWAR